MIEKGEEVVIGDKFNININGKSNKINISNRVSLKAGKIVILGSGNRIYIGEDCNLNVSIVIKSNDSSIYIGKKTTMLNVLISLHEQGSIYIGEDCMLSGGIRMDVSDMHSIIDNDTKIRINPAKDIFVDNHVWIANGVTLLKGTILGCNSVVGASTVTSGYYPDNSLVVGSPGKVIKNNINWNRDLI